MSLDLRDHDLSSLIKDYDQTRIEVASSLNRLHSLAVEIEKRAADSGDSHIATIARGQARHMAAIGRGVDRLRSLRTAERTNDFQREQEREEQERREAQEQQRLARDEEVQAAAYELLEARKQARQEGVTPSPEVTLQRFNP